MERIPAPTLDQITGYTVMEKMRSLIKNYVATTTQIIDRVEDTVTQEEIATYLEQYLSDYYTKEEIDELLENIDLDDYYTKSETDTLLSTKANASNVYTKSETDTLLSTKANSNNVYAKSEVYNKTETDNLLSAKANANNVYTKSEVYTKNEVYNTTEVYNMQEVNNLLNDKQDELTAGTGITIQNNVISATGGGSGNLQLIQATISPETPTSSTTRLYINNLQQNDIVFVQGLINAGTGGTFFSIAFIPNLDTSNTYSYKYPIEIGTSSSTGYPVTTYITVADSSNTGVYLDIRTTLTNPHFTSYKAFILRSVA